MKFNPNKVDYSKFESPRKENYIHALEDYNRTLKADKDNSTVATQRERLYKELLGLSLSAEEKVNLYLSGRGSELPPDGNGRDEICGSLLPSEEEVMIGMYPKRELYWFKPYTCGVYMFYTTDGKFRYIGTSQYIEYALHSTFCRWRTAKRDGRAIKELRCVRHILDTRPQDLRFSILERVPLSLLKVAERNNRIKYRAMWQYDYLSNSHKLDLRLIDQGKLNY